MEDLSAADHQIGIGALHQLVVVGPMRFAILGHQDVDGQHFERLAFLLCARDKQQKMTVGWLVVNALFKEIRCHCRCISHQAAASHRETQFESHFGEFLRSEPTTLPWATRRPLYTCARVGKVAFSADVSDCVGHLPSESAGGLGSRGRRTRLNIGSSGLDSAASLGTSVASGCSPALTASPSELRGTSAGSPSGPRFLFFLHLMHGQQVAKVRCRRTQHGDDAQLPISSRYSFHSFQSKQPLMASARLLCSTEWRLYLNATSLN